MYADGRGVAQDDVKAHMWLDLAAARSTGELQESVIRSRDTVAQWMTLNQIAEAQRRAREWDTALPREP
jgi:TPR repeat protein